ncbi:hypothetical protein MMC07_003609 [Pseudocyphellaria aurata]|nr:hypothetical protein [Pseudocyphellaria aurata]
MIPRTPTKANEEIGRITDLLASRWGLQFPVRDGTYSPCSPSKIKDPKDQVVSCIRFLTFKDPIALNNALQRFEEHAETIFSKWKYKPCADQDVLPRRPHAESPLHRDTFLRRSEVIETASATDELMKSLVHILVQAAEHLKKTQQNSKSRDDSATNIAKLGESRATMPMNISSKSPRKEQSRLDTFWQPSAVRRNRHVDSSHVIDQHPSSDEFGSDIEDSAVLADIALAEPPLFGSNSYPGASELLVQDEECFVTPPSTPAHSHEVNSDPFSSESVLQPPELVHPPQLSLPSKKRSFDESMRPPLARKLTRSRSESQHRKLCSLNDKEQEEAPSSDTIPIAVPDDTPVDVHCFNSFESTTSFGTSAMTASSTSLTRNTSIYTDSKTTSFDSSMGTLDSSDNNMHDRPSQTTRSEAKNSDHNVREYESMDVDDHWVGLPPTMELGKPSNRKEDEYLAEQLFPPSLLTPLDPRNGSAVSFRQLYEVTRVAMATQLPIDVFSTCLNEIEDVYEKLWSSLSFTVKSRQKSLPEKSSITAWERASNNYERVSLTGELKFAEKPGGPVFHFNLKPMKIERSYRLARKFGGDRFCIVGMPGISCGNLPGYLKPDHFAVRESIVQRLVDTDLYFLGRIWRAFYLKPDSKKPHRGKQSSFNEIKYRVYFFARDGHDFRNQPSTGETDPRRSSHAPMSIETLVDWFMPAKNNQGQTCLKFFSRLALGVSSTTPTLEFSPNEIIKTHDARAEFAEVRRLNLQRISEKLPKSWNLEDCVMNDGCARISQAAAAKIADMLFLDQTPSVFQGRIAGAKGLWMVDVLDEHLPNYQRGYWIEITESQLKFKGHHFDDYHPDPGRVTFEVHSYSKKLSAATLNFQLMPILANRGVPEKVFSCLLKEDMAEKVGALEIATDGGLALRQWNQDNNPVTGERASRKEIEMTGGVPNSTAEKINWFIEHGFEPKKCRELKDVLYKAIQEYCSRLENRMNISIGKSTSALMIADPLAILEPNEIHLGFSSTFRDSKSRWEDSMLHDTDVLVARLPALLPSDIQKVRAVFKPELRRYRDVVIFSSKGTCSLASKLSGGDYDGDRAWICWEPSIVDPFQNTSVPTTPSLEFYGIDVDTVKVSDLFQRADFTSAFLRHAFSFNLDPSMLGSCTVYHESLCYSQTTVDDPKAVDIGMLLGLLVDRAKAGIIFDENKWQTFLKKLELPVRLPKPAYKNKEKGRPTSHMIDKLVFEDAKGAREKALGGFDQRFAQVSSWDEDLVRIFNNETELAKNDPVLAKVLKCLKDDLAEIVKFWVRNMHGNKDDEFRSTRKSATLPFQAVVEKCRADFLAINPCYDSNVDKFHVVRRWNGESGSSNYDVKRWGWLKASAFFQDNNHGSRVWYIAGVELAEIKAMAHGTGTYRVMKREVHFAMKLNRKLVEGLERSSILEAETAAEEEEEDEYGVWGWD